jgi:Poly A polymerase head domain
VSLDLVNLRSETYTQDSRIPGAIQFGTPEQVSSRSSEARQGGRRGPLCCVARDDGQLTPPVSSCWMRSMEMLQRPASHWRVTRVQDALRRDLTINALFYNLDTCAVEDFSGQGLDDLRAGIIRTPLAPRETFMDGEQLDSMSI